MRIGLVSCSKSKLKHRAPARELYSPSALFLGARCYVERTCERWFILSAKHHLVRPDQELDPYEQTLNDASPTERRQWAVEVLSQLESELGDLRGTTLQVHAGSAYLDHGLVDDLLARGATVENPVEGLRQGERLRFYKEAGCPMDFELRDVKPIGPFDFRWPDAVEHFHHGWEGTVVADGRTRRFRHGIGKRGAYSRPRVHSVTWLDNQPMVEGVEADDYERSHALVSQVKRPDRKLARTLDQVPPGYDGFLIVSHRDEIDAPYSRNCLAVKIREDELQAWVAFALLRERDRVSDNPAPRSSPPPPASKKPVPQNETGPSVGLSVLLELERGVPVHEMAKYLRLYEVQTDYDRSLEELRRQTNGVIDPTDERHVRALLKWLRSWGCRNLRRGDEVLTTEAVVGWAHRWVVELPTWETLLTDLPAPAIDGSAIAFGELSRAVAAGRVRSGKNLVVRFGPTAAAKALHAVRPNAYPPWDDPIREALGLGGNDAGYRTYLAIVGAALRRTAEVSGCNVSELPRRVGRPRSSPPKLIDEYLWIRITRGLQPNAEGEER